MRAPEQTDRRIEAQEIEFDLVAGWTEDAVRALGPEYAIPAGCRGSGSPSDLAWLAEALQVGPDTRVVDVGSGVGGPAAWLAEHFGPQPVCAEPMRGRRGSRAAALRPAHGRRAPPRRCRCGPGRSTPWSAWACCAPSRARSGRRCCASCAGCSAPRATSACWCSSPAARCAGPLPEGNDFPTEEALTALLAENGFTVVQTMESDGLAQAPVAWQERADAVDDLLARHHGDDPRWQRAQQQTARISRLIGGGHVRPLLVHARAR